MSRTVARSRFIERMGASLADAGLPRLPSRVFAALVIDDDGRMTAAELAETLGVSPASISGAVKFLAQISFIHRERERGSRRDVYVVDDDAWLQAMTGRDRIYGPLEIALGNAIDALGRAAPAHDRLVLMREFLLFVDDEMEAMARRWLRRRKQLERDLAR